MVSKQQIHVFSIRTFQPRVFLKLLRFIVMGISFMMLSHAEDTAWKISARLTSFTDATIEGDGDKSLQFSGRLDAFVSSGELWKGGSLNAHFEYVDGDEFTGLGTGGVLLPTNIYATVPRATGTSNATLSMTLHQQFSASASGAFGKFNVIELARNIPLVGGKGKGGFQYTGIAAPPSFVFPPYVFGAQFAYATESVNYSLLIYDPNNAQGSDFFNNLFDDGVVFNGTATYKTSINDRPGFYGLNIIHSTASGTDYDSLLQSSDADSFTNQIKGVTIVTLKVQQYLSYNPDNTDEGWGIFGQIGFADGNPSQLDNVFVVGLAGTSPITGRGNDRWGIAGSRFNWSDKMIEVLEVDGNGLRDEWALEAFYEAAINDTLRVGLNIIQVQPGLPEFDKHIQTGVRLRASF